MENKKSVFLDAVVVTIHCLIGCSIGELIGLMIGVSMGLNIWVTMGLATILAFVVGMSLATKSVVSRQKIGFFKAFKIIWFGEVVSIGVMEIVMNFVDFWVGGVNAASIFDQIFWIGMLIAMPCGYIAALPVNYYLLSRHVQRCH